MSDWGSDGCSSGLVEMAGIDLELAEDRLGRQVTVVGQDDDMLAVVADRVGARGIDDDRTIMAELFLKPRMAVIPIGPRLNDGKFIDKLRARLDAGDAEPGNTVHLER